MYGARWLLTAAFLTLLDEGKLLNSSDFWTALRYLEPEDEDAAADPMASLTDNEAAQAMFEDLPELDPHEYDLVALCDAVQHDIAALQGVWGEIEKITPARDAKLQEIKQLFPRICAARRCCSSPTTRTRLATCTAS